tara:strand:- start:1977 stop:2519 length:543 start_codon:yes stop_codon:yes gene_type:complete
MNRKQIAENLGDIHRLVIEPKFVCRSCARSSSSQGSLCKPAAIPPQHCQDKPIEQQRACGLLAEALPKTEKAESVAEKRAQAVRRVIDKVKQKSSQPSERANQPQVESTESVVDFSDTQSIKAAKKALKKQYKQQKKLLKLAKKQRKLLKKQQKLEASINMQVPVILPELVEVQSDSQMH